MSTARCIYPGCGNIQRLSFQYGNSAIVEHIAGLVDHAVVAMGSVRVECRIGNDAQFRKVFFNVAMGAEPALLDDRFAAVRSLRSRSIAGKIASAGMPSFTHARHGALSRPACSGSTRA